MERQKGEQGGRVRVAEGEQGGRGRVAELQKGEQKERVAELQKGEHGRKVVEVVVVRGTEDHLCECRSKTTS